MEGLTIGAYAVGSHEGFIYVSQEYPPAVEDVNIVAPGQKPPCKGTIYFAEDAEGLPIDAPASLCSPCSCLSFHQLSDLLKKPPGGSFFS